MPVSIHETMPSFISHSISLAPGDAIYLFSDGYADQFGGPRGKKFMYKAFKNLLIDNSEKSMHEQAEILDQTMITWQDIRIIWIDIGVRSMKGQGIRPVDDSEASCSRTFNAKGQSYTSVSVVNTMWSIASRPIERPRINVHAHTAIPPQLCGDHAGALSIEV